MDDIKIPPAVIEDFLKKLRTPKVDPEYAHLEDWEEMAREEEAAKKARQERHKQHVSARLYARR